jgi:hypothetical protein
MSNLSDAVHAGLVQRNLEHEPVYWMAMTEAEALELSRGVVPEEVRSMASWLCEPLHEMVMRQRARLDARDAEEAARQLRKKKAGN